MGPVLLQEETGVPGENLRCLVESNWTTLFSHVTKVNFNQITARSRNRTLVTDKHSVGKINLSVYTIFTEFRV